MENNKRGHFASVWNNSKLWVYWTQVTRVLGDLVTCGVDTNIYNHIFGEAHLLPAKTRAFVGKRLISEYVSFNFITVQKVVCNQVINTSFVRSDQIRFTLGNSVGFLPEIRQYIRNFWIGAVDYLLQGFPWVEDLYQYICSLANWSCVLDQLLAL